MSCKLQDLQIVAFWLGNALQSENLYELVTFGTLYHYIIILFPELPWRWGGVGVEMGKGVWPWIFFSILVSFSCIFNLQCSSLATNLILV